MSADLLPMAVSLPLHLHIWCTKNGEDWHAAALRLDTCPDFKGYVSPKCALSGASGSEAQIVGPDLTHTRVSGAAGIPRTVVADAAITRSWPDHLAMTGAFA